MRERPATFVFLGAGEVASTLALDAARSYLAQPSLVRDPAEDLNAAVQHANRCVLEAARAPGRSGMGTTLVAFLICGSDAYTAEVGDSRLYLFRRAKLTQLSRDQTQMQVLLDKGLLTEELANASQVRSILLQACGKTSDLIVVQHRLALRHGDRVLLCRTVSRCTRRTPRSKAFSARPTPLWTHARNLSTFPWSAGVETT
jgi:protein phosphatase